MSHLRALVTGASRGIGRAIALRLAREGATVIVAARSRDQLERVASEIDAAGGRGLVAPLDVQEAGSVRAGVQEALRQVDGRLDVLVNNAGTFAIRPIAELDEETWERHLEVNLSGPFRVVRACLEALAAGTRPLIANIASQAARQGFLGNAAYCASKFGLRGLGDALREDLREQGIRVSTLYPGQIDTAIWDSIPGDWDRAAMGSPEDVAEVVLAAYRAGDDEDVADLDVPRRP